MLRLRFSADDLIRTRVAPALGPFAETVLAFELARHRRADLAFSSWLGQLPGRLGHRVHPLGDFYAGDHLIDLVTMVGPAPSMQEGIDNLRSVRRERLRTEIEWLANRRAASAAALCLLGSDLEPRARLADAISSFHAAAIRPHWSAVRNRLDFESATRMRALRTDGVSQLLATLCPQTLRWDPPVLQVVTARPVEYTVDLGGRGLVISPSVFVGSYPMVLVDTADEGAPLRLIYPAVRELATARQVWREGQPNSRALAALLGRTRSIVLDLIADGCGTVELARRAGISPAAASEHAAVLRRAGLVSRYRDGNTVLHTLTPLGAALLNSTAGPDG